MSLVHAVVALLLASTPTLAQFEKDQLTAHVTDPVNSLVPTASARLLSSDRVIDRKADSSADIHFTDVPAGTYELEVSAPGFAKTTVKDVLVPQAESNPIEVTLRVANQPDHCGFVNTVDYAPLRPGAALSGRIVDADSNKAVAKATVNLLTTHRGNSVDSTQSGKDGLFLFATVLPGRYNVRVSKSRYDFAGLDGFFVARENATTLTIKLRRRGLMFVCQ